jgi:hypothetical protein
VQITPHWIVPFDGHLIMGRSGPEESPCGEESSDTGNSARWTGGSGGLSLRAWGGLMNPKGSEPRPKACPRNRRVSRGAHTARCLSEEPAPSACSPSSQPLPRSCWSTHGADQPSSSFGNVESPVPANVGCDRKSLTIARVVAPCRNLSISISPSGTPNSPHGGACDATGALS